MPAARLDRGQAEHQQRLSGRFLTPCSNFALTKKWRSPGLGRRGCGLLPTGGGVVHPSAAQIPVWVPVSPRLVSSPYLELRGRLASVLGDTPAANQTLREALDLYAGGSITALNDRNRRNPAAARASAKDGCSPDS